MPISCGLKPLVSKNLGQNGDATPKAAYNAGDRCTNAHGLKA
jgi:hypothetical protein